MLNRGVNRERTDQIAARFERDVIAAAPAVVAIVGGVNDIYDGRGAAHAIAHLRIMYELAHGARIAVVAGTILPFDTATAAHNDMMRAVNDWIRGYAAHAAGVFVVADTRAAVARADNPDRLASTPDGLHPDAEGYRRMADALAPAIERALALKEDAE